MRLTTENKAAIDAMDYDQIIDCWRDALPSDPLFKGETREYICQRLKELREQGADHVGASKRIGWEK